jgi:hypothetical protein
MSFTSSSYPMIEDLFVSNSPEGKLAKSPVWDRKEEKND